MVYSARYQNKEKHSTGLGTADHWNKLENTKPDTNTMPEFQV